MNGDSLGGVQFTGWKPRHDYFQGGNTTFWDEGLVGQWLDWRNPGKFYYMSVPSYTGGSYERGETLNCGPARVYLGQTDGIEQILTEGLEKLLALSA